MWRKDIIRGSFIFIVVMKIRKIKISNLMSFPYLEDFENDTGILFDDKTEEDNMNILIGANGS